MGISASSLLDDIKSNYIRGCAEAELKEFSPHYRRQYSVAYFSQVQDELEQQKEKQTQLLKQRDAPETGEVLYEENVLHFDDTRKWKERYLVVRANYCLELHDSFESFVKGQPPRHKLLPTGGATMTTEEKYMVMVDKCFPDDNSNVKEEFAPPIVGMPGQFPVYLRLPYRRDSYFCFRQEARQAGFLSILSDCIRHQNQDFLKKRSCEVQAFLKAVQLYRQEKGQYESWDMLIGSDVRVLANLVMEELLPSLEKDMLPRLKAKKTERKRVWFATVEAAYILVQERLLEGLSALKEECRVAARQQEVLIRSDLDQILSSRTFLEGKLRASVSEPAEKFCSESVHPYLASVLEELMGPVSTGFQEAQQLSGSQMDQLCQDFQDSGVTDELKQALDKLSKPNLLSCYQRVAALHEQLHHLQERFGFSNIGSLVHSAQIDIQQLMENAAYTFELLLYKAIQDNPGNAGSAMEKAKHRVLKQYDYDSSTVRKRIFQEALVGITLPFIKKNLAPTCKTELQGLEQFIFADYTNFVHVENIYEGILLQTLDKEISKVVTEAASLKKHNLFTDSRDLLSQSSRSSLSTPPSSPARGVGSPAQSHPASPLLNNGQAKTVAGGGDIPGGAVVVEGQKDNVEEGSHQTETDEVAVVVPVVKDIEKVEKVEEVEEVEATPGVTEAQQTVASVAVETPTEATHAPTETAKGDTPAPTEATAVDTPAPTEAAAVDTPAPTEAAAVDTPAPTEAAAVDTPAPTEAAAVDTPAPTEAAAVDTPAPTEAAAVDTPAPTETATVDSVTQRPIATETVNVEAATTVELQKAESPILPETQSTESPTPVEAETPRPGDSVEGRTETHTAATVAQSEAPAPGSDSAPTPSVQSPSSESEAAPSPVPTPSGAPAPSPEPVPVPTATSSVPESESAPSHEAVHVPSPASESVVESVPVEDTVAESMASTDVTTAAVGTESGSSPDTDSDALPSSGGQTVTAPPQADLGLAAETKSEEPVTVSSSPSPGELSAESKSSPPSDIESPSDDVTGEIRVESEEVKVSQSGGDEVSTSDLEVSASESSVSAEPTAGVPEGSPVTHADAPLPAATGGIDGAAGPSNNIATEADPTVVSAASVNLEAPELVSDTQASLSAPTNEVPQAGEQEPSPKALDCIQEIRDLVVEVFEVEEMVQRYPDDDTV